MQKGQHYYIGIAHMGRPAQQCCGRKKGGARLDEAMKKATNEEARHMRRRGEGVPAFRIK